jgi:hypothetical protein
MESETLGAQPLKRRRRPVWSGVPMLRFSDSQPVYGRRVCRINFGLISPTFCQWFPVYRSASLVIVKPRLT